MRSNQQFDRLGGKLPVDRTPGAARFLHVQAPPVKARDMRRHHHILNAASNLLGIALLIIAGLHLSHVADQALAKKIAWLSALLLSASVLLSYFSIRSEPGGERAEIWADRVFLSGLISLVSAVSFLALSRI